MLDYILSMLHWFGLGFSFAAGTGILFIALVWVIGTRNRNNPDTKQTHRMLEEQNKRLYMYIEQCTRIADHAARTADAMNLIASDIHCIATEPEFRLVSGYRRMEALKTLHPLQQVKVEDINLDPAYNVRTPQGYALDQFIGILSEKLECPPTEDAIKNAVNELMRSSADMQKKLKDIVNETDSYEAYNEGTGSPEDRKIHRLRTIAIDGLALSDAELLHTLHSWTLEELSSSINKYNNESICPGSNARTVILSDFYTWLCGQKK